MLVEISPGAHASRTESNQIGTIRISAIICFHPLDEGMHVVGKGITIATLNRDHDKVLNGKETCLWTLHWPLAVLIKRGGPATATL